MLLATLPCSLNISMERNSENFIHKCGISNIRILLHLRKCQYRKQTGTQLPFHTAIVNSSVAVPFRGSSECLLSLLAFFYLHLYWSSSSDTISIHPVPCSFSAGLASRLMGSVNSTLSLLEGFSEIKHFLM